MSSESAVPFIWNCTFLYLEFDKMQLMHPSIAVFENWNYSNDNTSVSIIEVNR